MLEVAVLLLWVTECVIMCVKVEKCRMIGIMLLVFIRTEMYSAVRDAAVQWVGTGLLGRLVRTRCYFIGLGRGGHGA